jgi:DNA gyrase subunit A
VVSDKGYGKRTFLDDPETGEANYRITNRGGKGVKTINVTEKTGNLVGLLDVTEKQDLMITCVSGVTIRMSVASVSEQGRATQGVKLIKVDEGDRIAAITKLDEEPEVTDEIIEEVDHSISTEGSNDSNDNNDIQQADSTVLPDSD